MCIYICVCVCVPFSLSISRDRPKPHTLQQVSGLAGAHPSDRADFDKVYPAPTDALSCPNRRLILPQSTPYPANRRPILPTATLSCQHQRCQASRACTPPIAPTLTRSLNPDADISISLDSES